MLLWLYIKEKSLLNKIKQWLILKWSIKSFRCTFVLCFVFWQVNLYQAYSMLLFIGHQHRNENNDFYIIPYARSLRCCRGMSLVCRSVTCRHLAGNFCKAFHTLGHFTADVSECLSTELEKMWENFIVIPILDFVYVMY